MFAYKIGHFVQLTEPEIVVDGLVDFIRTEYLVHVAIQEEVYHPTRLNTELGSLKADDMSLSTVKIALEISGVRCFLLDVMSDRLDQSSHYFRRITG